MVDEAGARERAADSAREEARKDIDDALALARCPRCGKRDAAAARRFVLFGGGYALLSAVAVWVLGIVAFAMMSESPGSRDAAVPSYGLRSRSGWSRAS